MKFVGAPARKTAALEMAPFLRQTASAKRACARNRERRFRWRAVSRRTRRAPGCRRLRRLAQGEPRELPTPALLPPTPTLPTLPMPTLPMHPTLLPPTLPLPPTLQPLRPATPATARVRRRRCVGQQQRSRHRPEEQQARRTSFLPRARPTLQNTASGTRNPTLRRDFGSPQTVAAPALAGLPTHLS